MSEINSNRPNKGENGSIFKNARTTWKYVCFAGNHKQEEALTLLLKRGYSAEYKESVINQARHSSGLEKNIETKHVTNRGTLRNSSNSSHC